MPAANTLEFSKAEDVLFSELVAQTISTLRLSRGRRSPEEAMRFSLSDYISGQADMSCDQEVHTMLEFVEIIDSQVKCRLNSDDLPKHLANGSRFGVDLLWLFECFLSVMTEWHPDGWNHALFSSEPFGVSAELTKLMQAFVEAGYLIQLGSLYQWTAKAKSVLGLEYWGYATDRGLDARKEAMKIFKSVPDHWQKRFEKPRKDWSLDDWREMQDALSNHWYNDQWNDSPVRGSRERVYMRNAMHQRILLMLELSS